MNKSYIFQYSILLVILIYTIMGAIIYFSDYENSIVLQAFSLIFLIIGIIPCAYYFGNRSTKDINISFLYVGILPIICGVLNLIISFVI